MIYIDSDNAMGSPLGDVDDGYAIAALLRSRQRVVGLGSVFGNTEERRAIENNRRLAALCGWTGPLLRGAQRAGDTDTEAARFIETLPSSARLALLGPVTNAVRAIGAGRTFAEIIVVGSNLTSHGRWPPVWPHEFNLTLDRSSSRAVFESGLPLTIFPLDMVAKLKVTRADVEQLAGEVGGVIRKQSKRWFLRVLVVKQALGFRVADLIAAAYIIEPRLFRLDEAPATMESNTLVRFGSGARQVRVARDFDARAVWNLFVKLVNGTDDSK